VILLAGLLLAISIFFSLFGLGGGVLYVPILESFGYPLKELVIPLSLLMNATAGTLSLIVFARKGMVRWKTAIPVAVASMIGSPVGALLEMKASVEMIHLLFGILLLFVGIRMVRNASKSVESTVVKSEIVRHRIAIAMGFFAGTTSGMLGGGAGSILVPALIFIGFSTKESAGISTLMVACSSIVGSIIQFDMGKSLPLHSLSLIVTAILAVMIGSIVGSSLAVKIKNTVLLKRLFGVALLITAIKFLLF